MSDKQEEYRDIIRYELGMYLAIKQSWDGLDKTVLAKKVHRVVHWAVMNALTESRMLHTRQLCDLLREDCWAKSKKPKKFNDILLTEIIDQQEIDKKKDLLDTFRREYGDKDLYPKDDFEKTPRAFLNVRLAHHSKERSEGITDYQVNVLDKMPTFPLLLCWLQDQLNLHILNVPFVVEHYQ